MINIAVIPARSGSKRIKNKNIKIFDNKPIITHVIEMLKKTNLFKYIVVTSDSQKILNLSKKNKVDILINRPNKLSDDFTDTHSVIKHSIKFLLSNKYTFDNIFCVYPTSVFLNKNIINKALRISNNKGYIFSAIKYTHPIERSFKSLKKNTKINFPKYMNFRTQDIEPSYHDAGQFYLANYKLWLRKKKIISKDSSFIEIPHDRCHDIDNMNDWKYAELVWKNK